MISPGKTADLGANDAFNIRYSLDGGVTSVNINSFNHSSFTNSGSTSTYTWTLPDFGTNLDQNIQFIVRNTTAGVADTSAAMRVYFEPDVSILSPEGTEERKFFETIDITWLNADLGTNDAFNLRYSLDGGVTSVNINSFNHSFFTNNGDSSTYTWTLPDFGTNLDQDITFIVRNTSRNISDTSSAIRVYFEPDVNILSPEGTEERKFFETIDITWLNADLGTNDAFNLRYSLDGGVTSVNINSFNHSFFTNNGDSSTYTWTLPDFGTNLDQDITFIVRNTSRNISDTSSAIRVYFEPDVSILSPEGTEERKFFETIDITWLNADLGTNDAFNLRYSLDGGVTSVNINSFNHSFFTNNGDSSTYTWTLPDFGTNLDQDITFIVRNTSRNISDTSSAIRVYFEPTVDILSPVNGQYVLQGSVLPITWLNADLGTNDAFNLRYSLDGGATSVNINSFNHSFFTNNGDSSTYNWTVPAVESTSAKLIVRNTSRNIADTTLSFTICATCPAASLYYPNGGEVLPVGSSQEIGWSLGSTWPGTDNVVIDYSTDNGTNYTTIFDGAYSDLTGNTYTWTVPNTVTSQGLVRITNSTQSITDVSDANFSIAAPPLAPTDLYVIENTNSTLTLHWVDNDTSETSYRVQYSADRQTWTNYANNLAVNSTQYTTSTIGSNAGFWWRVVAVNATLTTASEPRYGTNYIPPGRSLSFDGTDDKVTLDSAQAFDFGTDAYTIEAWFKIADLSSSRIIVSDFNGSTSGSQGIYVQTDGTIAAYIGSNSPDLTSTTSVETDTWYHMALVRAGDSASIYLNGALEASQSGLGSRNLQSTIPMTIGQQPSGSSFYFAGELDELRFWSDARTLTEIQEFISTTVPENSENLLAYYRFDLQSGDYLPDRGLYNLEGTWTGPSGSNTTSLWQISGAMSNLSPIITVTTPNGGATYTVGDEVTISWTEANIEDTDSIAVSLSVDDGPYALIIKDISSQLGQSYTWTVPDSVSTSALIKVANTTQGVEDVSDAFFTIQEFIEPSVTVTSPNGGEFVEVGTTEVVTWDAAQWVSTDEVTISLSTDGGQTYSALSSGIAGTTYGDNTFAWTVDNTPTANALILVQNTTQNLSDTSDSVFTIGVVNRSLTLTSPNGGEQWVQNETYDIAFEVTDLDTTDIITIDLSIDGGSSFPYTLSEAALYTYGDSSFSWTVTQPVTTSALIRATVAGYSVGDTSDAVFAINEPNTAPAFQELSVAIVGDELTATYQLNEVGSIYMVVLEDGNSLPTATQVKDAASGGAALTGQVAIGSFSYETTDQTISEMVTASFERMALYDVYFTAEDAEANLNPGQSVPNVLAQYTPLEQDSIAVANIYVEMNGETWANTAADWNTLSLADRSELAVEDGRITVLNLAEKGMEGSLTTTVLQLDSLIVLNLSDNLLSGIPTLTSLQALNTVNVANNQLDFGDLESNAALFGTSDDYAPQAIIGQTDSLALPKGSSYTFQSSIGGEQNQYQWSVDNFNTFDRQFNDLETGTSAFYLVESLDYDNMGSFKLTVTNELLPGLTLETAPVQLWATANLEIAVYGGDELLAEGAAYALRNRGPKLPFDSIPRLASGGGDPDGLSFTEGYVLFENLLLGDYLIGIRSNPDQYLPTYYKNTFLWEEADTLVFREALQDTMQMTVIPPPLTPDDGSGTLSGGVESDFGEDETDGRIDARRKVKRAGCSIRRFVPKGRIDQEDGEFELVAYVESDDEGRFLIENIPAGLYRFNIEYPGIPMDPDSYVEFEIGEAGTTNNTIVLQATVTEDGIFVERTNLLAIGWKPEVFAYPNPASERMVFELPDLLDGHLIRVLDLNGRELYRTTYSSENNEPIEWDCSEVRNGVYFLNVVDITHRNRVISTKLVVKH